MLKIIFPMLMLLSSCDLNEPTPAVPFKHEVFEYMGAQSFPTDYKFKQFHFGGISGCYYNEGEKLFYAISDDKSEAGPARIYKIKLNDKAKPYRVEIVDQILLRKKDNRAFERGRIDQEAIFVDKDNIYTSNEGTRGSTQPSILKFSKDGKLIKEYILPDAYQYKSGKQGPRNNRALESLSYFNSSFYTAFESPFLPLPNFHFDEESPIKMIEFNLKNDKFNFVSEYTYPLSPMNSIVTSKDYGRANHGLVETVFLDKQKFLSLERSFVHKLKQSKVQIYLVKNMKKELMLNLDSLLPSIEQKERRLDNLEAMCMGPKQTIMLISDNNFNEGQRSLFIFLKLKKKL